MAVLCSKNSWRQGGQSEGRRRGRVRSEDESESRERGQAPQGFAGSGTDFACYSCRLEQRERGLTLRQHLSAAGRRIGCSEASGEATAIIQTGYDGAEVVAMGRWGEVVGCGVAVEGPVSGIC